MLTISNLAKRYGNQTLFEQVSLQLNAGSRYGIVGANGSGKSSLLAIISGKLEPSEGSVTRPKRSRLGVLEQDHYQYEALPIIHVVMMGNRVLFEAMAEKEEILANAETFFDADRYGELEDIILRHDGYSLESRAAEILEGLNILAPVHHDPLSTLSGGFKLRVLLAQTLAAEPDILLLDEPTNHLDILSIRWLEKFLQQYRGCVAIVSHDRRFLDNVCTHIIDVDYERALMYTGNYEDFERQKEEERNRQENEIKKREQEIADHKAFIERFKAKASKARQAQSRVKRMAKIEIATLPSSSRQRPNFRFKQKRPSGKEALLVKDLSKAFGDKRVLDDVSFSVTRGDRLAIIGPNGIGKSTLLKIAVGELEADRGSVQWGHEAAVGYYDQSPHLLFQSRDETVQDYFWSHCPEVNLGVVRSLLALALFTKTDVEKSVKNLSGGEMARLQFAALAVREPNVLVLDEPTNHLD
ncbi:MAG: ABC-F family ATP-binding cassette domain-containing protein, partial [Myxococcales bacterium]|nr:ABC-F family ATP-binding cassette domain-containing protein [Myxococcales bacterium]